MYIKSLPVINTVSLVEKNHMNHDLKFRFCKMMKIKWLQTSVFGLKPTTRFFKTKRVFLGEK